MIPIDLDQIFQLNLQRELIGRRVAILGSPRQGKTNTAAVLVEDLLATGLPLTIVDFKGEYRDLTENHQIRVVGQFPQAHLWADPAQAATLAALSVAESLSMLLDLSGFPPDEQSDFLLAYFAGLWAATNKKRAPYGLIIEEGFDLIPAEQATPLKALLNLMVLSGYRRGLSTIVIGQPGSEVTSDFIRQQEILFLHRVLHPAERLVYKDLIPLPAKEIEDALNQLRPGQAILVYNTQARLVRIKCWQPATAAPDLFVPQQLHQSQETLPLATKLDRTYKELLVALGKREIETELAEAFGQENKLNQDQLECLQKSDQVLQKDLDRLGFIITEQTLLLATLKDLKVYLEMQSKGLLPATGFTPTMPEPASMPPQPEQWVESFRNNEQRIIRFPQERNAPDRFTAKLPPADSRKEEADNQLCKLRPFIYKLSGLNNKEVILLSFLLAHEGFFYTRLEIFKFTGLFTGSLHHDFNNLLKMPFVEKESVPQTRIRSRTKEWAIENFPESDLHTIIQAIKDCL